MQTPGPGYRGLLPLLLFGVLLLFPAGCSSDPFLHKKGRNCLKLEPGRREGRINGTLVYLTTPAGAGGEVTRVDRKTVIEPLLSMTPRLKRPLRTIVIDPGHGGRETGAPGTLHQEKELNLALARKLRAELEKRGCRVIMTRDDDRFLPLNARGDLPGERDADLFLSIHHNSARDKTVSGAEIYLLTPDGVPSTNDPADSRPPGRAAGGTFALERYDSGPRNPVAPHREIRAAGPRHPVRPLPGAGPFRLPGPAGRSRIHLESRRGEKTCRPGRAAADCRGDRRRRRRFPEPRKDRRLIASRTCISRKVMLW